MDSCFAAWMKPQVLTRTTSASAPSARVQPAASSRAASSSESTSLRAQPSVTRLTLRLAAGFCRLDDTPADYGKPAHGMALATPFSPAALQHPRTVRRSAEGLLARAEAERQRVTLADRDRVPAVHRQRHAAWIADHQAHRLALDPVHGAAGAHDALIDLLSGRRGEHHPAVCAGRQADYHLVRWRLRDRRDGRLRARRVRAGVRGHAGGSRRSLR